MRLSLATAFLFAAATSCVHVTNCTCAADGCCGSEREVETIEIEFDDDDAQAEAAPMLTGRVVDERGQPIARAPVRVYGGLATRWQTGETVTDEQGRFSFEQVSGARTRPHDDGPWHEYVGVSAGETVGGLNPAAYLPWTDVTIAPGGTEEVTLVLDAGEIERKIAAERAR